MNCTVEKRITEVIWGAFLFYEDWQIVSRACEDNVRISMPAHKWSIIHGVQFLVAIRRGWQESSYVR